MDKMHYNFLVFLLCYNVKEVFTLYTLPDYIHPCSEFTEECFVKATRDAIPGLVKGIPEIGIPTLDPMMINHNMNMILPGNLNMTFYNGKITGLRSCEPSHVLAHAQNKTFVIDVHCDVTIKGLYTVRGRFLLFNLDTDGHVKIKMVKSRFRVEALYKFIRKSDGAIYYEIDDYTYKADYGESLKLNITNLIRGNPQLSAEVLQFINANSMQLAGEFGGPIIKRTLDYTMTTIRKFFDAYTYDQLVHVPFDESYFNRK